MNKIKAKVIKVDQDDSELKLGDIVTIERFLYKENDIETEIAVIRLSPICVCYLSLDYLEIIDEPEQLSIDTQARAILFEGECRMNGMLIDNKSRENDNFPNYRYGYEDFDNLQEEIQRRINELK